MTVVLLALGAAAMLGLAVNLQKRGLGRAQVRVGVLIGVFSMAACYWLMAPFFFDQSWFSSPAVVWFILAGLMMPALAQSMQVASVASVGASMTTAMAAFTPLFSVLFAMLLLGERPNLQTALAIAILICGLVLTADGVTKKLGTFSLFVLSLPLGMALFRGVAHPLTKLGLAEIASPFFATLVMTSVSCLVLVALTYASVKSGRALTWPAKLGDSLWFVASGVLIGLALWMLTAAVHRGSVTIAVPLASTTPLWALGFEVLVFRQERFRPRQLLTIVLVIVGGILLVTR